MQYICRWTLPHRYPGSLNHLQTDARTFADWGVITNYYRCRWHLHCFGAALWIHIVTHCGCERGGHCAVKYGEDFLQRSNKRIVDLLYHLFPALCWATWYLHQVDYVKLDGCHSDPATMEVSRDQPYKNILWWNMVLVLVSCDWPPGWLCRIWSRPTRHWASNCVPVRVASLPGSTTSKSIQYTRAISIPLYYSNKYAFTREQIRIATWSANLSQSLVIKLYDQVKSLL